MRREDLRTSLLIPHGRCGQGCEPVQEAHPIPATRLHSPSNPIDGLCKNLIPRDGALWECHIWRVHRRRQQPLLDPRRTLKISSSSPKSEFRGQISEQSHLVRYQLNEALGLNVVLVLFLVLPMDRCRELAKRADRKHFRVQLPDESVGPLR